MQKVVLFIVLIFNLFTDTKENGPSSYQPDPDLNFTLYRQSNRSLTNIDHNDVTVTIKEINVIEETMLNNIIQEEIVHYDGELLAFIYDLNPSLLSEKIVGNTLIKVPFFTVTDEISHKVGEGYKLRVTTNFQIKRDLVNRENLLNAKNDSLKTIGGKDTVRYHLISILDDAGIIVSNIKSRIRPISGMVFSEF